MNLSQDPLSALVPTLSSSPRLSRALGSHRVSCPSRSFLQGAQRGRERRTACCAGAGMEETTDPALEKSLCPHHLQPEPEAMRRLAQTPVTHTQGSGDMPAPGPPLRGKAGGCSPVPIQRRVQTAMARADGWLCPG